MCSIVGFYKPIEVVNSIGDLKKFFTDFSYCEHKDSDILSCASYLKTIKDDFNNTELPKLIDKLFDFYSKSYEIFIKGEKL
jgi:hypothetical protein